MATVVVDELRRQVIVTGLLSRRRIAFRDIQWVAVQRSALLDSLPNPVGPVIPAYEVLLGMQGGRHVQVDGGTSLGQLRSAAAHLAGLLRVPLCLPTDNDLRL
jgi:hypothetical protein